jgi:hypothetical protein
MAPGGIRLPPSSTPGGSDERRFSTPEEQAMGTQRRFGIAPLGLTAVAGLLAGAGLANAGPLDFSNGFGNGAGLTANGSAMFVAGAAQLTDGGPVEAGSVFANTSVSVTDFTAHFTFQLVPGTIPIADGITFTIQSNSPTALGASGGGLGYAGISNSVAVKFDTFNNAGEGDDSTGLFTNGAAPNVPAIDLTGTGIVLNCGDPFAVDMAYDGSSLNVTITDTLTTASASQSYAVNIASVVGDMAFVGFTGGSGALTAVQDINTFTFSTPQTSVAPEPSSVTLVALGGLGLIGWLFLTPGWSSIRYRSVS